MQGPVNLNFVGKPKWLSRQAVSVSSRSRGTEALFVERATHEVWSDLLILVLRDEGGASPAARSPRPLCPFAVPRLCSLFLGPFGFPYTFSDSALTDGLSSPGSGLLEFVYVTDAFIAKNTIPYI